MAWFRRSRDDESMDPQVLLKKAEATQPSGLSTGFRLTVEDVFPITGRGTVVTGRIETGTVARGATLRLTRSDGSTREVHVTGIESFRKILDTASAGDNVGLLLKSLSRDQIGRGDVLTS